jgi:folate-dependent phosphoribosylglycinamide formyltransferase PurN
MNPLRVMVFFTYSASGLKFLSQHDDTFDKAYEVVVAFTNNPKASGVRLCEQLGIPCRVESYKAWDVPGGEQLPDVKQTIRNSYFQHVDEIVQQYNPDIIVLSGFMLLIPDWFVNKYKNRMLNVHPADLRIIDPDTRLPKYRGDQAVRLQMEDGVKRTVSTIHIVTGIMDHGPIVTVSRPLGVQSGATWQEHQEWMKELCDGPAFIEVFKMLCGVDDPLALLDELARKQGWD